MISRLIKAAVLAVVLAAIVQSLPDIKRYLDYWVWWMYTPEAQFKARMRGKVMWVITVLSEEPEQASPLVDTLRRCAVYLDMRWGGVLLGNGSAPGDVLGDSGALARAATFFSAPAGDPATATFPSPR